MFSFLEPLTCGLITFSIPLLQFFVISWFDKIFAGLSWIRAEYGSIGWVCHHPFEASPVTNLLDSPFINLVGSPVNLVSVPAPCVLKSSMRRARSRIWIVWWQCKSDTQIGALLYIYVLFKFVRPFAIIFDDCSCQASPATSGLSWEVNEAIKVRYNLKSNSWCWILTCTFVNYVLKNWLL